MKKGMRKSLFMIIFYASDSYTWYKFIQVSSNKYFIIRIKSLGYYFISFCGFLYNCILSSKNKKVNIWKKEKFPKRFSLFLSVFCCSFLQTFSDKLLKIIKESVFLLPQTNIEKSVYDITNVALEKKKFENCIHNKLGRMLKHDNAWIDKTGV